MGAGLFLGLAAVLPFGLRASADQAELRATAPGAAAHEVVTSTKQASAIEVGPPSLLPRIEQPAALPDDAGLYLRTYQIVYGKRWERQVTWPVLAGPFDAEGTPWPCSLAVRFLPRFFDDGGTGGGDVKAFVDRIVRAQFPFSVLGLRFAAVASTSLHVKPVDGGVEISGSVVLGDSRRDPTQFFLKGKVALGERDGDLTARLERVDLSWRGHTRNDPLVALANIFMDVDDQARGIVADRLRGALGILKLPKEGFPMFDDRPNDKVRLRLCGAPAAKAEGVTLPLRMVAKLAEPRVDPSVPGPVRLEVKPDLGEPRPEGETGNDTIEVAASAAAAQQALYLMWQGGELQRWGKQERVVGALRDKMQDRVAFEVEGVDPRLPPTLVPSGDGGAFRVRFGDLALGRLDARDAKAGRRVVANGDLLAKARVEHGKLALSGTLADLRVTCVEAVGKGQALTPCFSDVVPVLRESGLSSEGLPLDVALPDRMFRLSLVLGTDLVLDGLRGELVGSPAQLLVRGEAKLVRRGN